MLNSVNTGIQYNSSFEAWQAAIAAGATLEELNKWDNGEYSVKFMSKVIAWYRGKSYVEMNQEDAIARKMKEKSKRRK